MIVIVDFNLPAKIVDTATRTELNLFLEPRDGTSKECNGARSILDFALQIYEVTVTAPDFIS